MKTSRKLREAVLKKKEVSLKCLTVVHQKKYVTLQFDRNHFIDYRPEPNGVTVLYSVRVIYGIFRVEKEIFVPGKQYLDLVKKDLMLVMERRDIVTERFIHEIVDDDKDEDFRKKCINDMDDILEAAEFMTVTELNIKNRTISELADLLPIFHIIRELRYSQKLDPEDNDYWNLVRMKPWKKLWAFEQTNTVTIPIYHFLHSKKFTVWFAYFSLFHLRMVKKMADENANFKWALIRAYKCEDPIGLAKIFDPTFVSYENKKHATFGYNPIGGGFYRIQIYLKHNNSIELKFKRLRRK